MSCCNSSVNGLIPNSSLNSLTNTGSGTELLIEDPVYGDDLIKTIAGAGGITITDNGTSGIVIDGTGLGGVQSVDNEGSGHELVDNTDPLNPKIKSIITGDGISMVNNGDDETISTDINYSSLDTNGKLNVYGLTQDFTDADSAKLIIGSSPSTFNYINNANLNSMTESTLGWVTNSEYQIVDRVSSLSNTSEITMTSTLIDLQTNGSVNIQPDVEFKSEIVVTPGIIYSEIDQTTTLIEQTVSNSTTELSKTTQIPSSYTAIVGDPLDDYSKLEITPTKIQIHNDYNGVDRSFRIDQGFSYLTGLPTFSDALVSIDQTTGLLGITSSNATLINYQTADLSTGTGNILSRLGNALQTALITCSSGPAAIQLVSSGLIQINGSVIELTNLTPATKSNIVYFDSTTKEISYGAVPSANSAINFTATTVNLPINSTTVGGVAMQTLTIPANTLNTVGDVVRFYTEGTSNNSGGANQIVQFYTYIAGQTALNLSYTLSLGGTNGNWRMQGYAMITTRSGNNATIQCGAEILVTNPASSATTSKFSNTTAININVITNPLLIEFKGNTLSTTTIDQYWSKCWKE